MLAVYSAESSDVQEQTSYAAGLAAVLHGEGRLEEALAAGLDCLERLPGETAFRFSYQQGKQAFVHATGAALALGRREQVEELLGEIEALPLGFRPPFLEAQAYRLRARLEDDPAGFDAAAARFRDLSMPFWLAVTRLEQAELLGDGEEAERLLAEARETFERLGATPWLERAGAHVEVVA